ncbi:hypothetical protein IAU60_004885 [Kwoniella sp. DSM 27419]
MIPWTFASAGLALVALIALRVYLVLPSRTRTRGAAVKRSPKETCSTAVFLGSGGHTSEMMTLLSTLPVERYAPLTLIYCHGDDMSVKAASDLLGQSPRAHRFLALPRARRVGESRLSTLRSASKTLAAATWQVFLLPLVRHPRRPFADVLMVNGPGTCVVLVLVCWIRRLLGLRHTHIIYVESFARVRSLSLSAKLVRPFVDRFVVQWPDAAGYRSGTECRGWLV